MPWKQIIDPLNSQFLSALVAGLPIGFIFWALIVKKMKGYQASSIALFISFTVATFCYRMPMDLAILSAASGAIYGIFPICWIIISAVFLFNITVASGQLEVIKHFMASITDDRRLQLLLIAFSFGSFLEGMTGFGAPVAITAAMLIGLGFEPVYAAGLCLVANTAPVAFGSIGIPITVASQVSGVDEMAISKMVGTTLPLISMLLPFYLTTILCGYKKAIQILPAVLVSGFSFAMIQWFSSNYIGPMLPDILAGIGSIVCLIILLQVWRPKSNWRFSGDETRENPKQYLKRQIVKAWSPFIVLTIMIIAWGLPSVRQTLSSVGSLEFEMKGLHNSIQLGDGTLLPQIIKFDFLSIAGTAIFISAIISLPLLNLSLTTGVKIFGRTIYQLRLSILTVAIVLGFAYLLNNSGITNTLARVLASTGILFPFFAPMLGWLGVFITGSDTSSNALFAKLQVVTANSVGMSPVVTVASNVSGGVVGKMISPQSIAVAAAAGNLIGKESLLFRFAVKHSFRLLFVVCLITFIEAYIIKWKMSGINTVKSRTELKQRAK